MTLTRIEIQKRYRNKHRESIRTYSKKRYQDKRDEILSYSREYYHTNKDRFHERDRQRGRSYSRTLLARYSVVKRCAKKRNITFAISFDEYSRIVSSTCIYCDGHLPETGGALDRKDNLMGYTIQNVVPCCGTCNQIKGDALTFEEMIAVAQLLKNMRRHIGDVQVRQN